MHLRSESKEGASGDEDTDDGCTDASHTKGTVAIERTGRCGARGCAGGRSRSSNGRTRTGGREGGETSTGHKVGEAHSTNDQDYTYVPVPDEVEDDEFDEEERAWSMSNVLVWESTELTFPVGEAWKVYPELHGL